MSADMRRDWRLHMYCHLGWQFVTEGTLAHCRRERDGNLIGPDRYWTDWEIRRPEDGRPTFGVQSNR